MLRIGSIVVLMSIFVCAPPAMAGVLDSLFGLPRPFEHAIDVSKKGIALDTEFKVSRHICYLLEIRFFHRHKKMGDLDDLLGMSFGSNSIPPFKLHIEKMEKDGTMVVFDQEIKKPMLGLGRGVEITSLELGFLVLERGRYHVTLEMLEDSPQFKGIAANFVVVKGGK